MGNEININEGRKKFKKPKGFLMAYSVNNYQPVQCTMISDQPFFYMDGEIDFYQYSSSLASSLSA